MENVIEAKAALEKAKVALLKVFGDKVNKYLTPIFAGLDAQLSVKAEPVLSDEEKAEQEAEIVNNAAAYIEKMEAEREAAEAEHRLKNTKPSEDDLEAAAKAIEEAAQAEAEAKAAEEAEKEEAEAKAAEEAAKAEAEAKAAEEAAQAEAEAKAAEEAEKAEAEAEPAPAEAEVVKKGKK